MMGCRGCNKIPRRTSISIDVAAVTDDTDGDLSRFDIREIEDAIIANTDPPAIAVH